MSDADRNTDWVASTAPRVSFRQRLAGLAPAALTGTLQDWLAASGPGMTANAGRRVVQAGVQSLVPQDAFLTRLCSDVITGCLRFGEVRVRQALSGTPADNRAARVDAVDGFADYTTGNALLTGIELLGPGGSGATVGVDPVDLAALSAGGTVGLTPRLPRTALEAGGPTSPPGGSGASPVFPGVSMPGGEVRLSLGTIDVPEPGAFPRVPQSLTNPVAFPVLSGSVVPGPRAASVAQFSLPLSLVREGGFPAPFSGVVDVFDPRAVPRGLPDVPAASASALPGGVDSLVVDPELLRPVRFDPGVDAVRPVAVTRTGELVEVPVRVLPVSGGTGSGAVVPGVTVDVSSRSVRPVSGVGFRGAAGLVTEVVGNVVSESVVRPALIEGGVLRTTQAEENLAALMEGRSAAPRDLVDPDTLNFRTFSGTASAGAGTTVAAGPGAGGVALVVSAPLSLLSAANQTAPGAQGRNDVVGDIARNAYLGLPQQVRQVVNEVRDVAVDGADVVSGGGASAVLAGSAADDLAMRFRVAQQAERIEVFSAARGFPVDLTGASIDTVARAYQDSGLAQMDEFRAAVNPASVSLSNLSELPAPNPADISAVSGGGLRTVQVAEQVRIDAELSAESVRRSGFPLCGGAADVDCVPEDSFDVADPASRGELRRGSGGVRSTDPVTGRVQEFPLCSTGGQQDCVPRESVDTSNRNSVGTVRRGDGSPTYVDGSGRTVQYADCDVSGQFGCLRPGTGELVVGTGGASVVDGAGRRVETVDLGGVSMTPAELDQRLSTVPGYQPPPVAVGARPVPQASPALRNPVEVLVERVGDQVDAAADQAERLPFVGGAVRWLRGTVPGLGGDGDPNR